MLTCAYNQFQAHVAGTSAGRAAQKCPVACLIRLSRFTNMKMQQAAGSCKQERTRLSKCCVPIEDTLEAARAALTSYIYKGVMPAKCQAVRFLCYS